MGNDTVSRETASATQRVGRLFKDITCIDTENKAERQGKEKKEKKKENDVKKGGNKIRLLWQPSCR